VRQAMPVATFWRAFLVVILPACLLPEPFVNWIEAVILGLVEGITEFLPISSTGHLILTQSLLGLEGEAMDRQLIIIQGAAILAVCWEYREKLWHTATRIFSDAAARLFVLNLFIAFLPLAILGLSFEEELEAALFAPIPVAIALIVGGFLILWAEGRKHVESIATVDEMRPLDAFKIGLFQALALIPGTSRAGATIIGGLFIGMHRRAATEFSFFIAIPTLLAATAYKLWGARDSLTMAELQPLAISSVVAFVSALLAVRFLIRFVSRHSFAAFAWYRIVFGIIILVTAWTGVIRW
jgi:undecaprenyl-diphosphatase